MFKSTQIDSTQKKRHLNENKKSIKLDVKSIFLKGFDK